MIKVSTVISSTIDSLKRRAVKVRRMGRNDIQSSLESGPYGIDSSPVKDMAAIHATTGEKGATIIIGYINKSQLAETGEVRIYSQDSNGNDQAFVFCKSNGDLQLNGDNDFAIRFNEMQNSFNQLKSDLNSLITNFNTHVHSGVTTGPGSSAITPTQASPSAADMSSAKVDSVKLP